MSFLRALWTHLWPRWDAFCGWGNVVIGIGWVCAGRSDRAAVNMAIGCFFLINQLRRDLRDSLIARKDAEAEVLIQLAKRIKSSDLDVVRVVVPAKEGTN